MQGQLGHDYDAFEAALNAQPPVAIRKNFRKSDLPWLSEYTSGLVPWCEMGHILRSRPSFTLDPLFHAGCYYVQEPSSMFLGEAFRQLVNVDEPMRVLDCCAAPGGKSTHIASLLNGHGLVVCNEVIRSRVPLLTASLAKWGYANTAVTSSDPSAFSQLNSFFDVILADAPCSGEGLFRKDPAAVNEWSPSNAQLCAVRQQRILENVWPSLKPGGLLIYSTCTWNPAEDEENLEHFATRHGATGEQLTIPPEWGIVETNSNGLYGYRFYPHRLQGEGFFLSVIRKPDENQTERPQRNPGKKDNRSATRETAWMLKQPEQFTVREKSGVLHADLVSLKEDLDRLAGAVPVIRSGISLGTVRHGKFTPEHDLALSLDLSPGAFPSVELDEADALRFLRKDTLNLTGNGIHLMTSNGAGIGWVNILPGRVNNMLPVNWRIRM